MSWTAVFGEAATNLGCITPALAAGCGVSERALCDRGRREGWSEPFPRVFVCPGVPESKQQTVMAAVLHCGDRALAGGWTAAWLWNAVNTPPRPYEVMVPHDQRPRAHKRIATLRTRTLTDADQTEVDGVPTTTLARTVGDLSGRTKPPFLRGVIIDGRQRGELELADVVEVAARRSPARGTTRLRTLCWQLDPVRCDSVLEELVRAALAASGFATPASEPVKVATEQRTLAVDIAWPQHRVGIEVDGFGSHSSRAHLDTDQRRHNALVLESWRVLRIGWWRLETDWDSFAKDLATLLSA